MRKCILIIMLVVFSLTGTRAQDFSNYISCEVNGQAWKAEAKKLKLPFNAYEYLAIAAFEVKPDVQVWIRIFALKDKIKPGTYPVVSEKEFASLSKKKGKDNEDMVWVLIDYTEETKNLGYGFHDGESLSGTLVIEERGEKMVKGTFEAELNGVYYKKRNVAALTGQGIRGNIEKKILTKAGGGMLANSDPHDHENTKKTDQTDTIKLSKGSFFVDWSKKEKDDEEEKSTETVE